MSRVRAALILLIALPACQSIGVREVRPADPLALAAGCKLCSPGLSPRTQQTLRLYDLERTYDADPVLALHRLHAETAKDPSPDPLFALCEVSYHIGRHCE